MKRIGITGASGFVATAVIAALTRRGDSVRALSRNPSATNFPSGVDVRQFDTMSAIDPRASAQALEGLDAVVHLAGESISGHWNSDKKKKILDSRSIGTRNLVNAMRACSQPPRVLVSASGSDYYGPCGDQPLDESSPAGSDFLAQVCTQWEREAKRAAEFGIRVVCLRQGLVLDGRAGPLAAMLLPFKLGAGGPLGSGRQWWPWIHLQDDVALFEFALDCDQASGPINAVSPDVASNARFSAALGHALRRPALAFAPPVALHIALGEFYKILLASKLILPARAQDLGFSWAHESLEEALLELLDPGSQRAPAIYRFELEETVAAGLDKAFDFFSNAANLTELMPSDLQLHMRSLPVEMKRGAIVEHEFKLQGLPVRWKSLITRWQPGVGFADVQIRGPFQLWRHQHDFESRNGSVLLRDRIDYSLPLAPLSDVALPVVRASLVRVFAYRRSQIKRLLR